MPPVKADIQAVTHGGTTTSPRAPMPRPAMIEAAITWVPGVEPGEHVQRQADPQHGAQGDVADHPPLRHLVTRPADVSNRLRPGDLHGDEIDDADGAGPRQQPCDRDLAPQDGHHHQRGENVGGGKERRQLGARDQLHVAQRRAFAIAFATGQAERFAARKARRNHPLVAIRSFVHPACRSTSCGPRNRRAFKAG